MKEDVRKKMFPAMVVSLFFGLTLFILAPAHLYFTNVLEFTSPFSKLLPILIGLAASCVLLTTALLVFMKDSVYQRALSILLALSFLLWFQGNVLVWRYGELDGSEIDWSAGGTHGLIDSAIWILLLIAALVLAPRIRGIAVRVAAAFIAIQLVSVSVAVFSAPDAARLSDKSEVDAEKIFEFSPEQNVIILILDSFQTDVFYEIISAEPRYRDIFDGFTYYPNALAGFSKTYPTISLLLTGRRYENKIPIREFVKEAFSGDSLPKILKTNGYRVDIAGNGAQVNKGIYSDDTIASSHIELGQALGRSGNLEDATLLIDLTLFRCVPHFLKKYVLNDYSWLVSSLSFSRFSGGLPAGRQRDAIEFMRAFTEKASADSREKTFKYIHLFPPHPPIAFNERLEPQKGGHDRESYKLQAKGTLELVRYLIDALKEIGVYDDTLMLVLADTGLGHKVNVRVSGHIGGGGQNSWLDDFVKARALPIFLAKQFESRGTLKISAAPVSVGDVSRTVISELGVKAEIPGVSVFDIEPGAERERRFSYHWGGTPTRDGHMPVMREFTVSKFSWLDESWQPSFRIHTPDGVKLSPALSGASELMIQFGSGGDSLMYQGKGWSFPEEGFTITNGNRAYLLTPTLKTDSDIELKATFEPFLAPGKVDRQRVEIIVNGKSVGKWECVAGQDTLTANGQRGRTIERTAPIPNSLLTGPIMTIQFALPDAVSPGSLGLSSDQRPTSLLMHSITLTPAPAGRR